MAVQRRYGVRGKITERHCNRLVWPLHSILYNIVKLPIDFGKI